MLGNIKRFMQFDRAIQIEAENGDALVVYLAPNLVQVRFSATREFKQVLSYALEPTFAPLVVNMTVNDTPEWIDTRTEALMVQVHRVSGAMRIRLANGQDVSLDTGQGLHFTPEGHPAWTRQLPDGEHAHGLGERATGLNLRGKRYQLWNYDFKNYQRGSDPLYYSIPFYLGVHADYTLGVFWDNPARGIVDIGATQPDQMTFSSETGELIFYVIADRQAPNVLKRYFELTGNPLMPPLWAFGYHQSRYGYNDTTRYRELMREFRTRKIPCDVLHFDISYMDGYRVFTYDKDKFGDLPVLLRQFKERGFRSIAILDPGVKIDKRYAAYSSGVEQDIFLKKSDGSHYEARVWAGESVFPDFTKPEARRWWGKQVAKFVEMGIDGLWNDMNEPTIFLDWEKPGEMPHDLPYHWDGHGSTQHEGGQNVYGMQMTRATYEGLLRAYPDRRPFVLTRSTYAGGHRYAVTWTGDNTSDWDHLKLSIAMALNSALSGMIFTGPDVGGFFETPDPELYSRWVQLASLFPLFRTHSMLETPNQEPWSFGKETEDIARKFINLRYQLLPYLYSAYAQASTQGLPMLRPTFFLDPNDEQLHNQDDAFMVGDALFVAPVLEPGVSKRSVYLPRGVWYDFWTNRLIDGKRTVEVEAPLDHMPIYARAGAVVPMWDVMQYVGEKRVEELQLKVFAGPGESAFYEDAGEGLGYQNGEYRWSYLTCLSLPGSAFAINRRVAGNYTPGYRNIRLNIIGLPTEPDVVKVDDLPAPIWFFEKGVVEILTSPFRTIELTGKRRDPSSTADTVVSRR
jgi:alpha-glucosidase